VQAEEAAAGRGKLKLFFGASPGVGKTYAMLEAARQRKKEGVDIVVGLAETHGRAETAALLEGLEVLSRKEIDYKGVRLQEFDIDRALARKPALILVDELAHTNAPGSRHAKRWQDVEELLDAGISVYTTLNVQHWESLNDVVAQVTGVVVRETVPDTFLERTHELEMVDLSPEDLLQRLKEGKVYCGELAGRAADNFFKPANLVALRELALRHAAERVDAQAQSLSEERALTGAWPVRDRLLVAITPSPMSPRLVRASARLSSRLQAPWIAVHVETPKTLRMSAQDRDRLNQTFKMAEQLGAETVTLNGQNISQEIIQYARSRRVTRIILGKPARPRWKEWFQGSIVNDVARQCGDIDLYIISGLPPGLISRRQVTSQPPGFRWREIAIVGGVVILCTLINRAMIHRWDRVNLVMVYLLGMMAVAYGCGRLATLVAAGLSVLAFAFFFVPPYFSFAISNFQYLLTFGVMLLLGYLISHLTGRLRQQTDALRRREHRTQMLYRFSRALSETPDPGELIQVAWRLLSEFYNLPILIFTPAANERLRVEAGDSAGFRMNPEAMGAAEWVFLHTEPAGAGTDTLSGVGGLFLPLRGQQKTVGVLGIRPPDASFFQDPDQFHLLETLAGEIGGALESTQMTEAAGRADALIKTERTRTMILTTFSHELHDPLAKIHQAAQKLSGKSPQMSEELRQSVHAIREEVERLDQVAEDLPHILKAEADNPAQEKEVP
jgi:two-component system sensor histidine kinase KdpD